METTKGTIGIETIKEALIWHTDLFNEISNLVANAKARKKKLNGWAALKFIDNLISGIRIGSKYNQIALEWKDLDDAEKAELKAIIQKELNIADEFAEEVAERILYLILEIGDTITFIVSKSAIKH